MKEQDTQGNAIAGAIMTAMIWISIPLWFINCHQDEIETEIRLQNKLLIELNR